MSVWGMHDSMATAAAMHSRPASAMDFISLVMLCLLKMKRAAGGGIENLRPALRHVAGSMVEIWVQKRAAQRTALYAS